MSEATAEREPAGEILSDSEACRGGVEGPPLSAAKAGNVRITSRSPGAPSFAASITFCFTNLLGRKGWVHEKGGEIQSLRISLRPPLQWNHLTEHRLKPIKVDRFQQIIITPSVECLLAI